ncbi:flagellin N-terminal helical domain-containing protein [Priestia flexa]|uniref:flagellin N-terminal helical domain-containing protein n=1 Tax=Priestia flexa TaxID=86664 RepID=UPI002409D488|nr:flagellin [Priestia flexa]
MRINHNIAALNTYRQLGNANNAQQSSMEKLSSGLRINRAGDDAAGLSISEKMRGQIRGLDQASKNAQDGISLIQTAEGALNETHAILQRQRELVVQAGNAGTLEADDLKAIQDEITQLNSELDGIADRTEFNGKKLLDGSYSADLQIGANIGQQHTITIDSGVASEGFDSTSLTVNGITADGTSFDADVALVDAAIAKVSAARSNLGANQNRLDHTINNLSTSSENLTAAESRIRDVDYALAA